MDILIVDDDKSISMALIEICGLLDCKAKSANSIEDALTLSNFDHFDIAIIDYDLKSGYTGLELMAKMKRKNPKLVCVIMTANPSIDLAVNAMKLGASDFITKPFDMARIENVINTVKVKRQREAIDGEIAKIEQQIEDNKVNIAKNNQWLNLHTMKRETIVKAIEESETLQDAADKLGIDKATLYRQRVRLGLIKKVA